MTWLVVLALALAPQQPLEGRWTAEARLGPEAMTLILDVTRRDDGLGARISVPAERVLDLGVDDFAHEGTRVTFRIPHADHPMSYAGTLGADAIDGRLAMGGRELPLEFRRGGPVPERPYRQVDVSFPGEGRTVRGALLLPPGEGPRAAIALFHATSGGRRDDVRFQADLAARQGMAALIYDRRAVPVDLVQLTRADFLAVAADAEAAVRFLRAHEGIDAKRVGVGGLSQGAWIAAIVATRAPEVAFVMALSAPGVPLHEIDLYQSTRRLEAAGVRGTDLEQARNLLRDLFTASRGEEIDRAALAQRLDSARRAPWAGPLALPVDVPPAGASAALLRWSAHDLDPARFFAQLRVPVFLAFGDRDERLPADACATQLVEKLEDAGNTTVTLHRYPAANHALVPAPGFEAHLAEWLRLR